jgi:hypothetical protein
VNVENGLIGGFCKTRKLSVTIRTSKDKNRPQMGENDIKKEKENGSI